MNEEIERYVRAERLRGAGEESIRNALIAKGWEYKLVDDVIAKTRPGQVATLFTRSFFRFAFGFITVIIVAVGMILVAGSLSQSGGGDGAGCILNCGHN